MSKTCMVDDCVENVGRVVLNPLTLYEHFVGDNDQLHVDRWSGMVLMVLSTEFGLGSITSNLEARPNPLVIKQPLFSSREPGQLFTDM